MKVFIFLTFDRRGRECCKKLSELEDVRVCKEVVNDVCNGTLRFFFSFNSIIKSY